MSDSSLQNFGVKLRHCFDDNRHLLPKKSNGHYIQLVMKCFKILIEKRIALKVSKIVKTLDFLDPLGHVEALSERETGIDSQKS